MAIYHIDVPNGEDLSLLKDEYYTNPGQYNFEYWSYSEGRTQWDNKFVNENKNYWEYPIETTYDFGKILVYWKVYGNGQLLCQVKRKSDSQVLITVEHTNGSDRPLIEYYLDFAVDNNNKKGYCVLASLQFMPNDGNRYQGFVYLADGGESLYNLLVDTSISGGAGSGYIGNSLLSNKKMVGYNVPTSSAESTKTESVNVYSASGESNKPKAGDGKVKIKLVSELPDTLVLYDNGQVNTRWFDTDANVEETSPGPISYSYEAKSTYLELKYNNWRNTEQWRGLKVKFNKKTFPAIYSRIRLTMELYAKYNSSWAAIEPLLYNDELDWANQTIVKNFNDGIGVRQQSATRYQFAGRSSDEATDEWTDTFDFAGDYVAMELSGVNQYTEATMKIKKITLLRPHPVQYTLEQLAKNTDFLGHCKVSRLSEVGPAMPNPLNDLQEYYGTDWNMTAYLRSGYTYSNGVFSRTQDSGDWRYIVIPLKDTYTVTAISIDVKELDRTTDWNGIQFWLGQYSGSGTPHFTDLEDGFIAAAKKPTSMSSTHDWFIEIPANSTDFNTLNAYMSGPVSGVNYIAFCTWAAEMQIKNIKLTVMEE